MIAAKIKLLMVLPFWHRSYYFAIAQRATVWQSCSLDWSLGWSEGERITPSVKLEASLLYIWEPATSKHYPAVQHSTIQHHPTIYISSIQPTGTGFYFHVLALPHILLVRSQTDSKYQLSFSDPHFLFFLILSSFLYLGPPENCPLEPSSQEWPSNMISALSMWPSAH